MSGFVISDISIELAIRQVHLINYSHHTTVYNHVHGWCETDRLVIVLR